MSALRQASEAEKRTRDRLTFEAWGAKLSPAQYLEREERLRAHPYARRAMRTWLLAEGEEVLASCETFRMRAFRQPGGGERGTGGAVEGIASVFTEAAQRGRGHAGTLMREVVARVKGEGALATILFSDVGTALYERAGYVARPALERRFAAESGSPKNVCDRVFDEQRVADELAQAVLPPDPLLIWPDAEQLDWHLERERIYSALLGLPRPQLHGAAAGSARAFWAADLKAGVLRVLQLAATRPDEALAVLQAAQRVAHAAGLPEVVLWECAWPFEFPSDGRGGRLERRSESLPMICPLAPGLDPRAWGMTSRATWI